MEYETQTSRSELQWAGLLGGLALGALAMYIADPAQGRRRRALLQDKVSSMTHQTAHAVSQKLRDTRNRLAGLQAQASHILTPRHAKPIKPIDDHVLEARVRSRLGRALSPLHQLNVRAHQGSVTLEETTEGVIDAAEMARLVQLVKAIPGVASVHARLHQPHASRRVGSGLLQGQDFWWMAAAAGAGVMSWYGISRRAPLGVALAAALGLLMRIPAQTRQRQRQRAETITTHETEQSIDIHAAPETVFDVWSRYENIPHFMPQVVQVRDLGQQRSHWIVRAADGTTVEWDAVLTAVERPHLLAWQTEAGASIEQHGSLRLYAIEGGTRATVSMAWHALPGAAGVLAGADPGQMLADDLQRLKQFIERGLPVRESAAAGKESGPVFH